ncbi:MAG: J domain-containing protein [Cyanobacteria bacterium Co-bin8]|nr:J domain-containing protein [Cyanobacteria bacterium Co-bin8]
MPEPDTEPKTHYQRLGIKPTASAQQIRRAYRDLSKLYHPDTTDLPASVATEKFQLLNEAYATLSSSERRWAYDQQMGYSRISVIQPPADLNTPVSLKRREYKSNAYLDPNDRPLSAGEIFALFILGITFVACLVLVATIGLTQGEAALAIPQPEDLLPTEQVMAAPPEPTVSPGFAQNNAEAPLENLAPSPSVQSTNPDPLPAPADTSDLADSAEVSPESWVEPPLAQPQVSSRQPSRAPARIVLEWL